MMKNCSLFAQLKAATVFRDSAKYAVPFGRLTVGDSLLGAVYPSEQAGAVMAPSILWVDIKSPYDFILEDREFCSIKL